MQDLHQAYKEAMNCSEYENKESDTEYRISINENIKTIIISFQGSRSLLDWKQNFTYWKKPYKEMDKLFFVHAGLFNKYKSVQNDIMNKIIPILKSDWKIRGYGFSQGATLITFFHEDIKYRFPSIDLETYAFAPAKGFTFWNQKFLKTKFKTLYTIKNVNDIVPKVPFWFMGFRQYGNIIKLGKRKLFIFPWNWFKEHLCYKELL